MKNEANNQSVSTDVNPYEKLDENDKLAVDMAVENVPYKFIAQRFKREHQTIKKWFMKDGRLYEAFIYQKKELRKEYRKFFKQIDQQIKDAAVEGIVTLRNAVKKQNMTGVVAARDILDRAGFKPKDKVEIESKIPIKVNVNFNWPEKEKTEGQVGE